MKKPRTKHCFRRTELEIGELYYVYQSINRNLPSDSLTLWKFGPKVIGILDDPLEMIYFNEFNPFVILSITQDPYIDSTYWYKVITKYGTMGFVFLDDTDMEVLHLWFKKPKV